MMRGFRGRHAFEAPNPKTIQGLAFDQTLLR